MHAFVALIQKPERERRRKEREDEEVEIKKEEEEVVEVQVEGSKGAQGSSSSRQTVPVGAQVSPFTWTSILPRLSQAHLGVKRAHHNSPPTQEPESEMPSQKGIRPNKAKQCLIGSGGVFGGWFVGSPDFSLFIC